MTVGTLAVTGMPRALARWIKLCGLALIAAACWWLLSVVDDERYLTPAVIVQWLEDAGSLAPLLLIVSMAGAVVIPPIPSIPLDLAAGAAFGRVLERAVRCRASHRGPRWCRRRPRVLRGGTGADLRRPKALCVALMTDLRHPATELRESARCGGLP